MLRALGTLAPFALVGCLAHTGDEGMFIVNNTSVVGTVCTLTGLAGQPFTAAGLISSASPSGYFFTPLIQSRITADLTNPSEIVQRTITLQGAHVTLSATPALTIAQPSYSALFAATVAPMGTVNVGFELVSADVIKSAGTTRTELVATVTPYGELGGDTITGTPYQYPITICDDCITNVIATCGTMGVAAVNLGDPCNPFQDGVVDCCSVSGTTDIECPSPGPTP